MGVFLRILQVVEALKAEEALQALEDVQNLLYGPAIRNHQEPAIETRP